MPPTGQPAPKKTCPRQTQELRSIHHVLIQAWYPTHSHLHSPPDPHPAPLGRMDRPTKLTRGKGVFDAAVRRRPDRLDGIGRASVEGVGSAELAREPELVVREVDGDRKSTRLNSSHA